MFFCVLSICDGTGAVSMGLAIAGLLAICPWDVDNDKCLDVLRSGVVLLRPALTGRVRFTALVAPCRSHFSVRRPMFRSWSEFLGCFEVLRFGLQGHNAFIHDFTFSAMYILCVIVSGWYFSLESPVGSLFWWQALMRFIMGMTGVICTHLRMISYGALSVKFACIMHNLFAFHLFKTDLDMDFPVMSLKGQTWHEDVLQFLTSLACACPPCLGSFDNGGHKHWGCGG